MRLVAAGAAAAVLIAACGSAADLSGTGYAVAMQQVEDSFVEEAPNPGDPAAEPAYPLGGDLVIATEVYMAFDRRLAGWRALTPPDEVRAEHDQLVKALEDLQAGVGDYLARIALAEGALDFETIGPMVSDLRSEAAAACTALSVALFRTDQPVGFADGCQF